MALDAEAEAALAAIEKKRGYVLPYHRVLVEHDLPLLRTMDELVEHAYLQPRRLSRREKELIFVVSLTVLQASSHHIESHINAALDHGAEALDVLEAIEIALPEAGVVAFQHGIEAWRRVIEARK